MVRLQQQSFSIIMVVLITKEVNSIKRNIKGNEFEFKKRYGQNFLADENIINKIVKKSNVKEDSVVIEIGVGSGNLTKKLAGVAKNVIGYEIDASLENIINDNLNSFSNVEIIYDDFLNRNIIDDLSKYEYTHIYVVANLPYYITTPIITKLIDENINIEQMTIMVQKEVGDRLNASPGHKEYNSLTIFINYYFEVSKLFEVSRNAFVPKPNVDSAIIQLKKRENKHHLNDEKTFFKLVRDSFRYKRKTLKNNLKDYDLEKVSNTLKEYDLDLNVRAEQLTIEQFVKIANNL